MKKVFLLVILMVFAVCFVSACGGSETSADSQQNSSTPAPTSTSESCQKCLRNITEKAPAMGHPGDQEWINEQLSLCSDKSNPGYMCDGSPEKVRPRDLTPEQKAELSGEVKSDSGNQERHLGVYKLTPPNPEYPDVFIELLPGKRVRAGINEYEVDEGTYKILGNNLLVETEDGDKDMFLIKDGVITGHDGRKYVK